MQNIITASSTDPEQIAFRYFIESGWSFRSVCTVSVPIEIAVNELAEKYRLVKGGTIRSEATKDKVRTLAPAVYANEVKMTVP